MSLWLSSVASLAINVIHFSCQREIGVGGEGGRPVSRCFVQYKWAANNPSIYLSVYVRIHQSKRNRTKEDEKSRACQSMYKHWGTPTWHRMIESGPTFPINQHPARDSFNYSSAKLWLGGGREVVSTCRLIKYLCTHQGNPPCTTHDQVWVYIVTRITWLQSESTHPREEWKIQFYPIHLIRK